MSDLATTLSGLASAAAAAAPFMPPPARAVAAVVAAAIGLAARLAEDGDPIEAIERITRTLPLRDKVESHWADHLREKAGLPR